MRSFTRKLASLALLPASYFPLQAKNPQYDYHPPDYHAEKVPQGKFESFAHAWQNFDINNYTRFDDRWWRVDRYKTRQLDEQELSEIVNGAIMLPHDPQMDLPGLLGYSIPGTDYIGINYNQLNGIPGYIVITHEDCHRTTDLDEGGVRRATAAKTGDMHGQRARDFPQNYS